MKKTWQTISETLNRRKWNRDSPQEFKLANGDTISEPKQIANAFNDFFIGIDDVGVLNGNTNNDFNQYMPRKTNCTLMFEPITRDTISRIISSLKSKTSTGDDNISNKSFPHKKLSGNGVPIREFLRDILFYYSY